MAKMKEYLYSKFIKWKKMYFGSWSKEMFDSVGLMAELENKKKVGDNMKTYDYEQIEKQEITTIFVFTNNGQSLKFSNVKNFTYTTTGFEFDYFGKVTKSNNHAVFNNTSVAGYSIKTDLV